MGQGPNSVVNIALVQSDGKIIAFGYFSSWNANPAGRVVRLNVDGTLDTSFTPGSGFDNSITTAALTSDNKIYAGGYFQSFNGVSTPYLTRLNSDGTRDATFNPILPGTLNPVSSLIVRNDGKVMVGKSKYPFAGDYPTYLFQVNPDGSPDLGFLFQGPDGGIDYILKGIDESLIVSGAFNSVNGDSRIGMFAILPQLPSPPDNLIITPEGSYSIELAWTDHSDNEIGYVIQRSAETPASFTSIDTTFANVTSFKDKNLTPGKTYLYRVASLNAAGSSSFTDTAHVDIVTGLKETRISSAFVWKNTQTGEFTVQTNWNNGFDLVVTDVMGRPVYSASSQDIQYRFQLPAQSAGIYILRIVSRENVASMRILN